MRFPLRLTVHEEVVRSKCQWQ